MAWLGAQGVQPRTRITVQTYPLARALAEQGLGASQVREVGVRLVREHRVAGEAACPAPLVE